MFTGCGDMQGRKVQCGTSLGLASCEGTWGALQRLDDLKEPPREVLSPASVAYRMTVTGWKCPVL
jgi:hypothetical protein